VSDLAIRPYEDTDEAAVLDLLAASLGKTVDDRYRAFFRWKHLQNPFGRSFMWVGELDGVVVGFRAFLRWRFTDASAQRIEAARAVDTATHPAAQGMGVFKTLTLHGLDELRGAGVSFVFNTPNDQSRPGYLKMGWEVLGRVPVQIRPRSLTSVARMVRSRTAAEASSLPTSVGASVSQWTDLQPNAGSLGSRWLVTDRVPEYLAWRYAGCPDVGSVVLPSGGGVVLVRFRRRGSAIECTVGDVLGAVHPRDAGVVVRRAVRTGRADYAIATTATPVAGMVRWRRLGPILTRRWLGEGPATDSLHLSMGDLELF
jgi:GNAT superfamily N-acetyltransferase